MGVAGRVQIVAAWAALALVAWQGALSVGEDLREMRHWTLDEHRRALSASPAERVRAALGEQAELWQAVAEHVPRDRRLLVSYAADARGPELFTRMQNLRALRCPAAIKGLAYDPRRAEPPVAGLQEYVLDLATGRDYSGYELRQELARGADFRLLLVGSEAP